MGGIDEDGEEDADAPRLAVPPPSLPYKVDTSRPSLRTKWTRRAGEMGALEQSAPRTTEHAARTAGRRGAA